MAIRNRFVICLFLLIILQPLFAQDEFSYHALSPGFFIDTENNVPRFIQRFVWHGGEYAHEYEVVIERESNGTFMHHLRDFADSNFINVSLPPGEYRIQIIPYDVFERAGTPSDWMYFEILHALTPYPLMVFSEIITDEDSMPLGFLIHIYAENFNPNAEVFLRSPDDTKTLLEFFLHDSDDTQISTHSNISAFIDSDSILPGEYTVVIRNPSGLEAHTDGLMLYKQLTTYLEELASLPEAEYLAPIQFQLKPVILRLGAAWSLLIPLYGDDFGIGVNQIPVTVRASAGFFLPIGLHIGPELTIAVHRGAVLAGVNFLAEKWLSNQRLALGYRLGVAFYLDDFITPIVNTGVSFSWRITDLFLLEGGMNYKHMFREIPSGAAALWIGTGFMF